MNLIRRSMFFLLLAASYVYAQQKPEAAWLIYPEMKDSPAIEIWASPSPERGLIWRLVGKDGSLLAEMPEPLLPQGYSFNQGQCKINGQFRYDVVALVKHSENARWSSNVSRVWIANPLAKSFVSANAGGVVCLNEAWGI